MKASKPAQAISQFSGDLPPEFQVTQAKKTGDDSLMVTQLQYLSNLLTDAGKLPPKPVLLWRDEDKTVKYHELTGELIIGRTPKAPGLAFAKDKLLSRSHLVIRRQDGGVVMEDLKSLNGVFVNGAENRTTVRELVSGDIIFAGNHIFVFSNHFQG